MKPFHKHVKDPADLARPLMICAPLSQGHSLDARMILGSVAGAELKNSFGFDLAVREQSSELLRALISARFMGWMPCASVHA